MDPGSRPFSLSIHSFGCERMAFLHAAAAVAEGAAVVGTEAQKYCAAAAALNDPLRRVCVLGGRPNLRRSLGSVYAGSVTRFLGGFRGVASRTVPALEWDAHSSSGGVALTSDGAALLVTATNRIRIFHAGSGRPLREIDLPWSSDMRRVCVAPDGFVFAADHSLARIYVLTPQLDFHGVICKGLLATPMGIAANNNHIVVSEDVRHCISVFRRCDSALVRRFGALGNGNGHLHSPCGVCFIGQTCQLAVADSANSRVSVFTLAGEFVRHVGIGTLGDPLDVASSGAGELFVADDLRCALYVFSADGELLHKCGHKRPEPHARLAICGSTVVTLTHVGQLTAYT